MEAVRAFNNELSSLYEVRPPVSRAKMAHVTKCAIKAIKFYKHVVQSVEKFIQKCKPEYKVPGLYVIDSIVRQSRHQFGSEKDVFAPRFTKNIVSTFQNLFKCPPEERSRVVRVLNLWQRNAVFPIEVIQPLLDLAADPDNVELVLSAQRGVERVVSQSQRAQPPVARVESGGGAVREADPRAHGGEGEKHATADHLLATQSEMLSTVTKLLSQTQEGGATSRSAQQQQLQQLQLLQQQLMQQTELMQKPEQAAPLIDNNLLAQIQTLTNQLLGKPADTPTSKPPEPGFNKKLLDFDYGESDEEEDRGGMGGPADMSEGGGGPVQQSSIPGNVQTILNDPAIMQHIQQMSATLKKSGATDMMDQHHQHLLQQQEEFDKEINQDQNEGYGPLPGELPPNMPPPHQYPPPEFDQMPPQHLPPPEVHHPHPVSHMGGMGGYGGGMREERGGGGPFGVMRNDDMDLEHHQEMAQLDVDERDQDYRHHRSRDRSRSPRKRRRSRSRSRDRDRDKRRRSRSRDRHHRSRSRDRERERQREKERERKKKGLPPIKDHHLSVCTTTLWLGHIAKTTTEEELRTEIENYGQAESINMIPPRGCAFVCMKRRKDAARALDRLKGVKINGNSLKVAWAPGIGVKGREFKDCWDVELGVSYIPWTKLPADLDKLTEGGIFDEDSLPEHLKGRTFGRPDQADEESQEAPDSETGTVATESGHGMTSLLGTPPPFVTMSGMMPVMPTVMPPMMMSLGAQLPQPISTLTPRAAPHMGLPPTTSIPLPAGLPPASLRPPVQALPSAAVANLAQVPIPSSAIGETMERELSHDMSQDSESPGMNSPSMMGGHPAMASPSAPTLPAPGGLSSVGHLMPGAAPPILSRSGFPPRPPGGSFPSFDPRVPPPSFRMPLPGAAMVRPPFASSPRPGMLQGLEPGAAAAAAEDKDMRMEWPGQGGAAPGGRSLSVEDEGPEMGMSSLPGGGGGGGGGLGITRGNLPGMMGLRAGFPPRGPLGPGFPRHPMGLGGPPPSSQQQQAQQQQQQQQPQQQQQQPPQQNPNPMLSQSGLQPMSMRPPINAQSRGDLPMSVAGPLGIPGLGGVGPRINLPGLGGGERPPRGPAVNLLNLVSESQRLASQGGGSLAPSAVLQGALRDALHGALQTAAANMAAAGEGRGPPNLAPRFPGQVPVGISNRPGILGLRPGMLRFQRFPASPAAGFQRGMGPQGMFPGPNLEPGQPPEGPANLEQGRFGQGRLLPTNSELEKWRAERQNQQQEGPPGITPPFLPFQQDSSRNPDFDGRDQDGGRGDADRDRDFRDRRRDDREEDSFGFGRRERPWDRDRDRDHDRGRDRDRDRRDRDRDRDRERDRNRDRDREDRDRGDSDRHREEHPGVRAPDQPEPTGLTRRERSGRQSRWSEAVPTETVPVEMVPAAEMVPAESGPAVPGPAESAESQVGAPNLEPSNPSSTEAPAGVPTDFENPSMNNAAEPAADPPTEPVANPPCGPGGDGAPMETSAPVEASAVCNEASSEVAAPIEEAKPDFAPGTEAPSAADVQAAPPSPEPTPSAPETLAQPIAAPEVTRDDIPSEPSFPVQSENHAPAPVPVENPSPGGDLVSAVQLSGVSVSAAEAGSVAVEVSGEGSMLMDGVAIEAPAPAPVLEPAPVLPAPVPASAPMPALHNNGAHGEPEAPPASSMPAPDVSVVGKLTEVAKSPAVVEAVDTSVVVERNGPSAEEGEESAAPVEAPANSGEVAGEAGGES